MRLGRVETDIDELRSNAYRARALVSENAATITKNYGAAFNGNRQLANQNTDDLFRNRLAIVSRARFRLKARSRRLEARTGDCRSYSLLVMEE